MNTDPKVIGRCTNNHVVHANRSDVRLGFITCRCGARAIAETFRAKFSNKKCDSRCTAAKGSSCSCQCGGANHGSASVFV